MVVPDAEHVLNMKWIWLQERLYLNIHLQRSIKQPFEIVLEKEFLGVSCKTALF
jgi:hypothetical protein